MITKKTIIDQIEITRHGTLQIRFAKLIEEDGVPITEPQYHRTSMEPDTDPVTQMTAVNTHLEAMGLAPVAPAEVAKIAAVHAAMGTLETSAAYKAALAAAGRKP